MVQALLYNIKVTSNWAAVMAKDTAATNSNTKSKAANAAATTAGDKSHTDSGKSLSWLSRLLGYNSKAKDKNTKSTMLNTYMQRLMNKSTKTAGYNIGGLSIRIHESLVPALAILASAMLPVIAGLLAIGSAAIVALGGVAGVAAVGLLGWSKKYSKLQETGGYAGGRQPFTGGRTQPDFMSEVMSGFSGMLDDPKIQLAIDWTEDLFKTTLPNAFKAFLDAIEWNVMEDMLGLFTDWLPNAAKGLAKWGQTIYSLIGKGSLKRINDVFKWIAAGLINVSKWLKPEGFDQIDQLSRSIADFAGEIMSLGKEALPIINDAMTAIYPQPFKPIMQGLTGLFKTIGESERGTKAVVLLTQLFIAIAALKGLELFVAGFISLGSGLRILTPVIAELTGWVYLFYQGGLALAGLPLSIVVAFSALGALILLEISSWDNIVSKLLRVVLINLGSAIVNTFAWILNKIATLSNTVLGTNFGQFDYLDYVKFENGEITRIPSEQVWKGEIVITTDTDMISAKVLDDADGQIKTIYSGLHTAPGGFQP